MLISTLVRGLPRQSHLTSMFLLDESDTTIVRETPHFLTDNESQAQDAELKVLDEAILAIGGRGAFFG